MLAIGAAAAVEPTRSGSACQSPAVKGKTRCRMHGGVLGSGAPEGKRHGRYNGGMVTKFSGRLGLIDRGHLRWAQRGDCMLGRVMEPNGTSNV